MTKTIKLDNERNYLIDRSTGEKVRKFDKDNKYLELTIELEHSVLNVPNNNITVEYGDQVVVKYCGDKYIIDDDYQPVLVKAGYIVYKNYDNENIRDPEVGSTCKDQIIADTMEAFKKSVENFPEYSEVDLDSSSFVYKGYRIRFCIDPIPAIVAKNQLRKDNSLPFYPFDKKMDKYGTIYMSIFAEKLDETADHQDRYNISNNLVKNIVQELGSDYHFVSQLIKRRVIYATGL